VTIFDYSAMKNSEN